MSIAVRMPGLDLWKAQVQCQAGCPVAGVASLLPSGAASRLLITSVIVNPVDAVRTGI